MQAVLQIGGRVLKTRVPKLHIELTTDCPLSCPLCSRTQLKRGGLLERRRLSMAFLQKRVLEDPVLGEVRRISLCGNYGDPAESEVIRRPGSLAVFPSRPHLTLTTNGVPGDIASWRELGEDLGPQDHVIFAIDGVDQASYRLYRAGGKIETVLAHAAALIDNSVCTVSWKYIDFTGSIEQREAVRKLARDTGFHGIIEVQSKRLVGSELALLVSRMARSIARGERGTSPQQADCLMDRRLYIDSAGLVWPCCWIADDHVCSSFKTKGDERLRRFLESSSTLRSLRSHRAAEILAVMRRQLPALVSRSALCLIKCGMRQRNIATLYRLRDG